MFDDRELLSSQPLPNDYVRIFRRVGILISQQHGRDHNYWLTIFNFLKLYLGVWECVAMTASSSHDALMTDT